MALMSRPEPMPVEVTAAEVALDAELLLAAELAVDVAGVGVVVDVVGAVLLEIVELIRTHIPCQYRDLSAHRIKT